MQGKESPANIRTQRRCQHANHDHIVFFHFEIGGRGAAQEHLHHNAVQSELSDSVCVATPSPSPPLQQQHCLFRRRIADSFAAYASSSRRAPPDHGEPTRSYKLTPRRRGCRLNAESGACPKSGSAGIAHRTLLSTQDGGVQAAEWATTWARAHYLGTDGSARDGAAQAAYESHGPSSYPTPPAALRKDRYFSDSESEHDRPRRGLWLSLLNAASWTDSCVCAQLELPAQGLQRPAPSAFHCNAMPWERFTRQLRVL